MCGVPAAPRWPAAACSASTPRSSPPCRCPGRSASARRPRHERAGPQRRPRRARQVRRHRRRVLGPAGRVPAAAPAESGSRAVHRRARAARLPPARRRLRRRPARGGPEPRRGAGDRHRPGAGHDRGGAPACRAGGPRDRLPRGRGRGARARAAAGLRCGHLPRAARARARPRRHRGEPRRLAASRRRADRLDPEPQPALVPHRHRRRRVPAAPHPARHPRVRALHPSGGARALGPRRRPEAGRHRRHRAQSVHAARDAQHRRRGELPGAFHPMSTTFIVLLALAALLTGALLGALLTHLRAAHRLEAVRMQLVEARVRLESGAAQDGDRVRLLEQSETRLRAAFDELAGHTLRSNSELFLRLAREALGRDQMVAEGALKEREVAIAHLVEPLRAALERTEAQVQSLEHERREAFASLRTQIESVTSGQAQLQRETRNLVTALRRPEVRGRWGELTLRRLVELAGLSEHCDFTEQLHLFGEEGALRPDLVVHMPEARDLVIDAKTPIDAYLAALEANTEEERQGALRRHAQQVEARVRELASKSYWTQFEHSPEFAVLFLPGDQFLSAALAERPDLIETALGQSVIIATPSTLI